MKKKPKPFPLDRYIIAALRKVWRWYPPRQAVKKKRLDSLTGLYKCDGCGKMFNRSEVHVDHIKPVIDISGFVDWNTYVSRLFVGESDLQLLCKLKCHRDKTREENEQRRRN